MTIYKLEQYSTYQVSGEALYSKGGKNMLSRETFKPQYNNRNNCILAPLPSYIKVNDTNNTIENTSEFNLYDLYNNIITPESTLWVHSNCNIPRAKVFQKYTRTIKPDKADFCIVPSFPKNLDIDTVAIFINKKKYKVYYIKSEQSYINGVWQHVTPWKCANKDLNTSVLDINPSLKNSTIKEDTYYNPIMREIFTQENWNDFLNSTLMYYGYAILVPNKQSFIVDVLYKKYNNIVSEDALLSTLGDESNTFTKELCDNIKEMLSSTDTSIVELGLKTLAELDYKKFRNTAVNILCSVSARWYHTPIKRTASVSYMLKFLGLWDRIYEKYSTTITQEDFELLQQLIDDEFHNTIKNMKNSFTLRFPFVNVDFNYNTSIYPKLESFKNN